MGQPGLGQQGQQRVVAHAALGLAAVQLHGSEPPELAERLRARFPADGAAATARLERIRRGDDIAQQERERRETGRSLSNVHLGAAEGLVIAVLAGRHLHQGRAAEIAERYGVATPSPEETVSTP